MKSEKLYWRINEQIRAPEVRLLGPDNKQIGIVSRAEALSKAKEAGLDLIEIAPKAQPPVVKIEELGKFRYQEEKKLQKQKKGAKTSDLKEIRFSPFIAEHDFETRFERINQFLQENNKVRAVVVFKGRQLGSKNFGYQLLKKLVERLGDKVVIDMEPKFIGRHLVMVVSPTKKIITKKEEI